MSHENNRPFPLVVRAPHSPVSELWRMALRGDDVARRELLRRIMRPSHAPTQAVIVRAARKAA